MIVGYELGKGTCSLPSAIATEGTSDRMRVGVLVTGGKGAEP